MIKGQEAHIPQEAIIGISYAVASAAVIVAMSKSSGESEHLKDMLVGNILSVSPTEVMETAALYVVHRPVPLRLPEAVPADLDESGGGGRAGHLDSACGTSSSTRRSGSSSRDRWRLPACCWCSAT